MQYPQYQTFFGEFIMAVIEKRISKDKNTTMYREKVRVRGYPSQSATFERKTDADKWAQRTEAEMKDDKYFPNTKAKKHTVSELIDVYLKDQYGKNRRRHDEVKPMLDWWKGEVGHKTLSHFMTEDVLKGQQTLLAREKTRTSSRGKAAHPIASHGEPLYVRPANGN